MISHTGVVVSDYAKSKAFYVAAITAGCRDNGASGLHPAYHANGGGSVLNPDGQHIEAVCHEPA